MNTASFIRELWEATGGDKLTDDQLRKLAQGEELSHELRGLSSAMTGVGCLISSDGSKDGVRAGNFQSHHDVPGLLFSLANSVEAISEAVFVSDEANAILLRRAESAGKNKPAKG